MESLVRGKWIIYVLLLAIFLYFNFDRYINKRRFVIQRYFVERNIKSKLADETIVISMSTTPHRIHNLKPTIDSILTQNAPIKAIYLSVPYLFKRDNLAYDIPQWLLDNKKITILRTDDYGPATKLLGVLEKVHLPPEAIIVTLDDDIIYGPNLVLQLAYRAKTHPNEVITTIGANPDYDANGVIPEDTVRALINDRRPGAHVSVIQGFAGVAYRRKFFQNDVFQVVDAPRECINSDDIYLSFYLRKRSVPLQVLSYADVQTPTENWNRDIGQQADALHNLEAGGTGVRNRTCINYLKAQDPAVVF